MNTVNDTDMKTKSWVGFLHLLYSDLLNPLNVFCLFLLVAGRIWNFKTRSNAGLALCIIIIVFMISALFMVAFSVNSVL